MFRVKNRTFFRFAAPLLATATLSGCGGGGAGNQTPPESRARIGTLDITFTTTQKTFQRGKGVPFTLTVTNAGPEIDISSPGSIIWVDDGMVSGSRLDSLDALIEQGGTRVTRHSSNNYGAHGYKFPAGQTREYAFTWWQRDDDGNRVEAGTYRITPFTPRELPLRLKDQETQFIAPPLEIIIE